MANDDGWTVKRTVPGIVWLLAALSVGASVVLATQVGDYSDGTVAGLAEGIAWSLVPAAFAVTAALIVARQPRNVIGWLLMISAVGYLSGDFVSLWLDQFRTAPDTVTPGLLAALAWDNFSWVLLIFPIFHLLLVFPSGKLVSRLWRWVVWLEISAISMMAFLSVFPQPASPFDSRWSVDNPIALFPASLFEGPFLMVWTLGLLVVVVSGVASVVVRFRRAGHLEREQIKWLLFAVALFAVFYALTATLESFQGSGWLSLLMGLSLVNIAAAIAIAVMRYRLFEIDRIISRTVSYALVVASLGLVYAGGAVWLPTLIEGEQPPLFVAGATLLVAALFNPLRRRIQRWVDRRFNRSAYQAEVVAEQFSTELRDSLTIEEQTSLLTHTVADHLHPAVSGLWVNEV